MKMTVLLKYTLSSFSFLSEELENNAAPHKTTFPAKTEYLLAFLANGGLTIYMHLYKHAQMR